MNDFLNSLIYGVEGSWTGGIAHAMIVISLVIAIGKLIGKYKIAGISLGVTWVLFIGLIFGHFGITIDSNLLHFLKEFGLILFVYSIGMQVGPGFFSTFKSGGIKLNAIAFIVILAGVGITLLIGVLSGIDTPTMTGIMSGAVTNTPGLGAAQTTFLDITGEPNPDIATAYAVAYPLGVVGCIMSFIFIKTCFYKNAPDMVSAPEKIQSPEKVEYIKEEEGKKNYISRRIVVSKRKLNGVTLESLELPEYIGVTFTRIRRSGLELVPNGHTRLQYGDLVTAVGTEESVKSVEKVLGNSVKRLDAPNLVPIFLGIALGCVLGSIPIMIPGIPQAVKLGLAGGPLIVSILIAYFGPRFKVVTYATNSAGLMLREIGISLFLACVGLEAGAGFIETIVNGGYIWIVYGAIITILPMLVAGLLGRYVFKVDCNTLLGVLAGSSTNPPALAYSIEQGNAEATSVGYASVYPLSMFLRVLAAQMLILMAL